MLRLPARSSPPPPTSVAKVERGENVDARRRLTVLSPMGAAPMPALTGRTERRFLVAVGGGRLM
jgi:hypothetical protein